MKYRDGMPKGDFSGRNVILFICSVIFFIAVASPLYADIYVKRHSDGTLSFSNCPQGGQWDVYYREKPRHRQTAPQKAHYKKLISDIATSHGMDPKVIKGIVQVESGYNPQALSSKGAMGLMQLMPETASAMGISNPWDPVQNITAGTKYFSRLLRRYQGDMMKALAAYNAGPTVVDTYGGIPPYQETKEYVKSVLAIINGGRK
jgi:soluble lytic murein transglycosylase-like protein